MGSNGAVFSSGGQLVGGGNQTVSKTTAPIQVKQPVKAKSGGVGGWLYNNLIKPTVTTVADLPSDAFHTTKALGEVGASVVSGHKGAQLAQDKQTVNDEIRKSPSYGQFFGKTVKDTQAQNTANTLEKIAGKTGSNVINVAGPTAGAEATTAKALIKLGAKVGAAGGAAASMQRGDDGGGVINNALIGGAVGGATGAAGAGLAKTAGALIRKAGGRSIAPVDVGATPTTRTPNLVQRKAAQQAETDAQNTKAEHAADFAHVTPSAMRDATSYDRNGQAVGHKQVSEMLRAMGTDPTAKNMQAFHDVLLKGTGEAGSTGWMNGALDSALKNAGRIDAGSPLEVAHNAVAERVGSLGEIGTKSAADRALAQVRQTVQGNLYGKEGTLGGHADARNVLQAIRGLQGAKTHLSGTDPAAPAMREVYQDVIDHLNKSLDSNSNVNESIAKFKVDPNAEAAIRADVEQNGLGSGVSDHIVNSLNNGKTHQDWRSAMQPGIVSGDLAKAAREAEASSLPKPVAKEGSNASNIPAFELASMLHSPGYAAAAAVRGSKGISGKVAAKVAPKAYRGAFDEAMAPSELAKSKIAGAEPAVATEAATPAPKPPIMIDDHSAGNVLERLKGGVHRANIAGTVTGAASANMQPALVASGAGAPSTDFTDPALADTEAGDMSNTSATDTPIADDSQSEYPKENMIADIQRDPKHQADYIALYKELNPDAGKTKSLTSTEAATISNGKSALSQLDNLESTIKGGSGSTGPVAGRLRSLNPYDSSQKTFESQINIVAQNVAKGLEGGKLSDQDILRYRKMLPTTTDTQQTALAKLANVRSMLENNLNNYSSLVGSDTSQ